MREAVTIAPNLIEVRDVSRPGPPGPGEALLEVAAVGLCGSDLEMFRGTDPYSHFPSRQGHEVSAHILELGPGSSGHLSVGGLVAVDPLLSCGTCIACRRGHPNCCVDLRVIGAHLEGALTEQIVMPIANLHDAAGLSPEEAAFVEPVSVGLHMVARSGLVPGEQAVVFGAGPIGQSAILAAREVGVRVMAIDVLDSRLQLASLLGAEETANAAADVETAIREWTNGDGPIAVFEATGSTQVFRKAIDVAAHGGTVVVAGTPTGEVAVRPFLWVFKELNVLGSRAFVGTSDRAVQIVRTNQELVRALITHTYPLERVQDAMEFAIANPHVADKVVIRIGA